MHIAAAVVASCTKSTRFGVRHSGDANFVKAFHSAVMYVDASNEGFRNMAARFAS